MLRPAACPSPLHFGRRAPFMHAAQLRGVSLSDDARLFLFTYAAGFLAVSFFIA